MVSHHPMLQLLFFNTYNYFTVYVYDLTTISLQKCYYSIHWFYNLLFSLYKYLSR